MAVVLGESSGFVIVVPTADPAGSNTTIDGSSVVTKHTSPVGANAITEVGWYRGVGTNTSNFEIALYADSSGAPGARLFVDATNSSNVQGWIITAVNWAISESTDYWIAVQMDAHSGSSSIDTETAGGAGSDVQTSQTALNDPYGGGAVADADGMYAIYAKVSVARNVTPGVGELTIAGFSPSVVATNHQNVTPGLGELTITGFVPTVSVTNHINVSAGLGELTITGFAPTVAVTEHQNITTSTGELVIAGFSPTVFASDSKEVLPGVGEITVTGFEPTVVASDHKTVSTSTGELTITGYAPTVSVGSNQEVLPGAGELSITGFQPTVETPRVISVGVGELIIEGFAPIIAISDHKIIQPGTGELIFTGFAPEVTGGSGGPASVNPGLGELVIEGYAPEVRTRRKVRPVKYYGYVRRNR